MNNAYGLREGDDVISPVTSSNPNSTASSASGMVSPVSRQSSVPLPITQLSIDDGNDRGHNYRYDVYADLETAQKIKEQKIAAYAKMITGRQYVSKNPEQLKLQKLREQMLIQHLLVKQAQITAANNATNELVYARKITPAGREQIKEIRYGN